MYPSANGYYVILGIHGTDPTASDNTARVRMFVTGQTNPTDQDFALTTLAGADASIAPSNYQDQYQVQIDTAVQAVMATLAGGGGQ